MGGGGWGGCSVDRHRVGDATELSHGDRLGVRSRQAGAGGSYPRRAQLWNQEASGFKFWCQFLSHVHGLRVGKEELTGLRREGKAFQAENPAAEAPAEAEGMTFRKD